MNVAPYAINNKGQVLVTLLLRIFKVLCSLVDIRISGQRYLL